MNLAATVVSVGSPTDGRSCAQRPSVRSMRHRLGESVTVPRLPRSSSRLPLTRGRVAACTRSSSASKSAQVPFESEKYGAELESLSADIGHAARGTRQHRHVRQHNSPSHRASSGNLQQCGCALLSDARGNHRRLRTADVRPFLSGRVSLSTEPRSEVRVLSLPALEPSGESGDGTIGRTTAGTDRRPCGLHRHYACRVTQLGASSIMPATTAGMTAAKQGLSCG